MNDEEQRRLDSLTLMARNAHRAADQLGDYLGARRAHLANKAYEAEALLREIDRALRVEGGRP